MTSGYRRSSSLLTRRQFAGTAAAMGLLASATPAMARHHDDFRGGDHRGGGGDFGFRRGINIYHMMREPKRLPNGDFPWPPYSDAYHQMSDAEIADLRAIGFDFVRLAITPDIFSITSGARNDELYGILEKTIDRFLSAGIRVLADLHPTATDNPGYTTKDIVADIDGDSFARYARTVTEFARKLATMPKGRVGLQFLNEPEIAGGADTPKWQQMAERLHGAAREGSSDLLVFLTGTQETAPGLMALELTPFRGSNVAYSFHYYEPHTFTHQGVAQRGEQVGLPWPTTASSEEATVSRVNAFIDSNGKGAADQKTSDKAAADSVVRTYFSQGATPSAIAATLGQVGTWADSNGVPRQRVVMTEFGVERTVGKYFGAPDADRLRWLAAVRTIAERQGFGWALWSYSGPTGMTLANEYPARTFDNATLQAIGLHPAAP